MCIFETIYIYILNLHEHVITLRNVTSRDILMRSCRIYDMMYMSKAIDLPCRLSRPRERTSVHFKFENYARTNNFTRALTSSALFLRSAACQHQSSANLDWQVPPT